MEKYGTVGQATDDNVTGRMRFACWISKAIDTHLEYVTLIDFPWLRENAPQYYVYMYNTCLIY